MTNFKIGQKVICINSKSTMGSRAGIEEKKIYTISRIDFCKCGDVYLEFSEIKTHTGHCTTCMKIMDSYCGDRFRPLIYNSATEEILEKFKLTEEKADIQIKELETCIRQKLNCG